MEDDIQKLSSQPHISLINHDRIITEFLFIFSRHILSLIHIFISFDADMSYIAKRTKTPTQYLATGRDENGKLLYKTVVELSLIHI